MRVTQASLRSTLVAVCLLTVAAALSALFIETSLPIDDEGAILTAAAKILRGDVFYRDIDAYWFPGGAYLLALFMELCGEHLSVARWLAAVSYCLLVLSLYLAAARLLDARRAALFGACLLGFKFVAFPALSSYLYWDLAVCAAAGAVVLLLAHFERPRLATLAGAGLCTGLALVFKQNVGIYLGVVAVLLLALPERLLGAEPRPQRERLAAVATFALSAATPVLPMLAYFAWHGVLGQLIQSGLLRPFSSYLPSSSISFFTPLEWWSLGSERLSPSYIPTFLSMLLKRATLPEPQLYQTYRLYAEAFSRLLYTTIPLTFGWATFAYLRDRRRGRLAARRGLHALTPLAGAVMLSAFPRADMVHVVNVYPLVLLLLFAVSQELADAASRPLRYAVRLAEASAVAVVVLGFSGIGLLLRANMVHRIVLERASVWTFPDSADAASVVRFVRDEIDEGEPLFVYGNQAFFYFLTDRYSDWPFSQLYPGQTGKEGGAELVRLLDEKPPELVVRGIVHRRSQIPPISEYAPLLHTYLLLTYVREEAPYERYPPVVAPRSQRLRLLRRRPGQPALPRIPVSDSEGAS